MHRAALLPGEVRGEQVGRGVSKTRRAAAMWTLAQMHNRALPGRAGIHPKAAVAARAPLCHGKTVTRYPPGKKISLADRTPQIRPGMQNAGLSCREEVPLCQKFEERAEGASNWRAAAAASSAQGLT